MFTLASVFGASLAAFFLASTSVQLFTDEKAREKKEHAIYGNLRKLTLFSLLFLVAFEFLLMTADCLVF
jgi:hypothetical protein